MIVFFNLFTKMPLLNITFWFLTGLIAGWLLATAQDDGIETIINKSAVGDKPVQDLEINRTVVADADEIESGYIETEDQNNRVVIEQFEKSLQQDSKEAVTIYRQEVRVGSGLSERIRSRLIARIVRLIQLRRYQDAQQLVSEFLDTADAYDAEVLMLQAQLYHILARYLEALSKAYDAKIYGDQNIEQETINRFIAETIDEYEKQLVDKKEWDALVALYSLVVEKDYSEHQSSYYYKLAQAQFKLGDYYNASASLSQIIGHPLWHRKAQYFQQTIEKFIAGDGIIAIPVKRIDPHKFLVIATINDAIEAELLIDTGASLSVIKEKFVEEIELPVKDEEPLKLTTVSDVVEARTIKLDSFGINEVKFADMSIGVTEMPEGFLPDGLLGMDFLSKFEFNLDQEALTLYLYSL